MNVIDTKYPIAVSMSGLEWDSLVKNIRDGEALTEEVLCSLRSKRIIVPTKDQQYRLSDPVADVVKIISNADATVGIECPSAKSHDSSVYMFFGQGDHVIVTRTADDHRVDFLLAELGESPLSTFLKLAAQVPTAGTCASSCYVDEEPKDFSFSEEEPFVRFTFENGGAEGGACVLFARRGGGAWLLQGDTDKGNMIIRCGDRRHIDRCLSDFLDNRIQKLKRN